MALLSRLPLRGVGIILSDKQKCNEHPAFAIVLEVHVLGDENEIRLNLRIKLLETVNE